MLLTEGCWQSGAVTVQGVVPCNTCCLHATLQVERARKHARTDDTSEHPEGTELQRSEADGPIKLSLAATAAARAAAAAGGAGAGPDKQQQRGAAAPALFGDDDDGELSGQRVFDGLRTTDRILQLHAVRVMNGAAEAGAVHIACGLPRSSHECSNMLAVLGCCLGLHRCSCGIAAALLWLCVCRRRPIQQCAAAAAPQEAEQG
jgi:hypothetical protein